MSVGRLLIVNPNADLRVTRWLEAEVLRIAAADWLVEAVNADSGLAAIETPEHVRQAGEAVARALAARRPDAAVIGAFGDPGLAEARMLGLPVVGLGESGLSAAGANGRRFALVTLGAAMRDEILDRIARLGLSRQLSELRILPYSVPQFVGARDAIASELAEAVRRAGEAAEAVLLGGAPFAGLGAQLSATGGLVVLDGVKAALSALAAGRREPASRRR